MLSCSKITLPTLILTMGLLEHIAVMGFTATKRVQSTPRKEVPIQSIVLENLVDIKRQLKPPPEEVIDTGTLERFGQVKGDVHEYFIWKAPKSTIGTPLPKPKNCEDTKKIHRLSDSPIVTVNKYRCDLITFAIDRYKRRIFKDRQVTHIKADELPYNPMTCKKNMPKNHCAIQTITINVDLCKDKEIPHEEMNEFYRLSVNRNEIVISSPETWGILRGLETLAQLVYVVVGKNEIYLAVNEVIIEDSPKYAYRGLMLDTARHYIPPDKIFLMLKGMEMNKLNVFHWHLTDDQSFPFSSYTHPELANKGAFSNLHLYNYSFIRAVVEYSRRRGIRVIPEIDIPGHTGSWAKSHPELMTQCVDEPMSKETFYGPLNPTFKETMEIIEHLYAELDELFPDAYIHLGLDEVGTACWRTDPSIIKFMKKNMMMSTDQLLNFFIYKLQKLINEKYKGKKIIVWQEAREKSELLSSSVVVQIWKSRPDEFIGSRPTTQKLIFSTDFYLDKIEYGSQWTKFYLSEFGNMKLSQYIGGEACMWNEYQSAETVLQTIWPSASAVAEKLWYGTDRSLVNVAKRIEEQRCRMLRNGIPTGVASGSSECFDLDENARKPSWNYSLIESICLEIVPDYFHHKMIWQVIRPLVTFIFGLSFGFYFRRIRSVRSLYFLLLMVMPSTLVIMHVVTL